MGKVLHASASGYFPTCIQDGAGYWTLEKAMEVYWRVRIWELNMSATYLFDDGEVSETITTSPGDNLLLTSGYDIGQEEQLVCGGDFFVDGGVAEITFSNATKSGSLYSPGFNFFASWDTSFSGGDFQIDVQSEGDGDDVRSYSVYGSTSIQFSYTLIDQFAEFFFFQDASFSLVPIEWWSYGGTYNTSTGEPL